MSRHSKRKKNNKDVVNLGYVKLASFLESRLIPYSFINTFLVCLEDIRIEVIKKEYNYSVFVTQFLDKEALITCYDSPSEMVDDIGSQLEMPISMSEQIKSNPTSFLSYFLFVFIIGDRRLVIQIEKDKFIQMIPRSPIELMDEHKALLSIP